MCINETQQKVGNTLWKPKHNQIFVLVQVKCIWCSGGCEFTAGAAQTMASLELVGCAADFEESGSQVANTVRGRLWTEQTACSEEAPSFCSLTSYLKAKEECSSRPVASPRQAGKPRTLSTGRVSSSPHL